MFYYGLDLAYGSPANTCLLPLKEAIFTGQAYNFGFTLVVAGVNALLMFLLHGVNYFRPVEDVQPNLSGVRL